LRPAVGAFARPLTAPSRYPEYQQFFELLSSAIDLDDPAVSLLDVGSPKLFALLLAARRGATIVATDLWRPAIDEAEALRGGLPPAASERLHFETMDAREPVPPELLPPNGKFDGAFSMSVIEHIEPDPGGDVIALRQMAEAVRPGGCVVVSVPIAATAYSEYRTSEIYGRKRGAFFQRVYDAAALETLCKALAPTLTVTTCVVSEWPDHVIMRLQKRFPTAIGFVGASFPLLASCFVVSAPSPALPQAIRTQGDAIIVFKRL
jgi:2-polyprenyl-3-methyl-5-hydroxy-6-metoxy-1,4-benzoquinol methylase